MRPGMRRAYIYRPSKTAMQSGRAKTDHWVLEFERDGSIFVEPLMGWIGSADTRNQVRLEFGSRDAAIAFAERRGLAYEIREPHRRRIRPKSYADNFAYDRVE
ncbi:MAG: ETC complex I subunit [Rhodospirillales bacterium]|nr:ETC complex I subunit [Rhodospirillales bacterium]